MNKFIEKLGSKQIVCLCTMCFIFLWSFSQTYFQARFLIILLIIPAIYEFYKELKIKEFKNFFIILFVNIFLFLHYFLNFLQDNTILSFHAFKGYIFLNIILFISIFYYQKILENLIFIIKLFYIIFFVSVAFSLVFYQPNENPFFCGGITNILIQNSDFFEKYFLYDMTRPVEDYNFSIKEFIFKENSHLGMIAPAIILYSINYISKNKNDRFMKIGTFCFVFVCLIKGSTTLIVGTIISTIIILTFKFYKISNFTKSAYLIILIFAVYTFVSSSECKRRLVPYYYGKHFINEQTTETVKVLLNEKTKYSSITSAVYYHSFKISLKSILEKPFGWGLNRYEDAFDYYNKLDPPTWIGDASEKVKLESYNRKDAGNNFVKIIVEFGVFGIVFYFFLLIFVLSKKIPTEIIIFLIPMIITQSIRGAGYFNGGFVLVVLMIILVYFQKYKIFSKLDKNE